MPRSLIDSPSWTSEFLWVTPGPSSRMERRSSVFGIENDPSLREDLVNSTQERWSALLVGCREAHTTDRRIKELFKNAGAQWGEILHIDVDLVSSTSEAEMLSSLCF